MVLKSIFKFNGFPEEVINRVFSFWFHRFRKKMASSGKEITMEDKSKKIYLTLPFIKRSEVLIRRLIYFFLNKHNLNFRVILVPTNYNNLGKWLMVKDKIPKEYCSKVVYNAQCKACNASYIGQTSRYLDDRIKEHFCNKPKSNLYDHIMECCGNKNLIEFRTIFNCSDSRDLLLAESILIKLKQPTINKQLESKLICTL